jgi:hypothetical protein
MGIETEVIVMAQAGLALRCGPNQAVNCIRSDSSRLCDDIVPRQYSTGGKAKLLGISKRGNVYGPRLPPGTA